MTPAEALQYLRSTIERQGGDAVKGVVPYDLPGVDLKPAGLAMQLSSGKAVHLRCINYSPLGTPPSAPHVDARPVPALPAGQLRAEALWEWLAAALTQDAPETMTAVELTDTKHQPVRIRYADGSGTVLTVDGVTDGRPLANATYEMPATV